MKRKTKTIWQMGVWKYKVYADKIKDENGFEWYEVVNSGLRIGACYCGRKRTIIDRIKMWFDPWYNPWKPECDGYEGGE